MRTTGLRSTCNCSRGIKHGHQVPANLSFHATSFLLPVRIRGREKPPAARVLGVLTGSTSGTPGIASLALCLVATGEKICKSKTLAQSCYKAAKNATDNAYRPRTFNQGSFKSELRRSQPCLPMAEHATSDSTTPRYAFSSRCVASSRRARSSTEGDRLSRNRRVVTM